ncbi:MAG TPA: cupredoxin domain-containing protein [Acidimicrobiia bacterium]|nr:cupredoxin domain-containing protein [Acidimicrobiia bacterium]
MSTRTIAALFTALVLAGCGGGDSGSATTTTEAAAPDVPSMEVTVSATEFSYSPETIEVEAGTPVTLTLINNGVVEHDITIDDLGVVVHANPGETVSETITVPAGEYHVHCSIPGHHEAGMMGLLVAR